MSTNRLTEFTTPSDGNSFEDLAGESLRTPACPEVPTANNPENREHSEEVVAPEEPDWQRMVFAASRYHHG